VARIFYYLIGQETLTTDKAVVEAYTYPVSSKIDGTIGGVFVSNRQYVKAGDLLAEMDKKDLEGKLSAGRVDLAQERTRLPQLEIQRSKAQAELEKATSKMRRCEKELAEATSDYQYISKIRNKKGVSPLLFERTKKAYDVALGYYDAAKTTFAGANDLIRQAQTLRNACLTKLHNAETQMQHAETQLLYTKIFAPANGHVVFDKPNFARRLTAGEPFLKLIGDDPWVVANFNANQLRHIKPGQRVKIRIEAIKEHTFKGEVVSVASVENGSSRRIALLLSLFALIDPPQNLPVKVTFDSESELGFAEHLDPDLNAFVEIDTKSRRD
ncbi:MAG: HlyD family secretion protein, partial [Verrucomicrobia bacterium]|nr:HlyD family secretion protein [Verrucomicrobiota bacterium]